MRGGTAQLGGDFLGGVAFHFPDRNRAQVDISQAFQQPLELLGHLGGELGGGIAPQHLVERSFLGGGAVGAAQGGLIVHGAAAALLAMRGSCQVKRLAP